MEAADRIRHESKVLIKPFMAFLEARVSDDRRLAALNRLVAVVSMLDGCVASATAKM